MRHRRSVARTPALTGYRAATMPVQRCWRVQLSPHNTAVRLSASAVSPRRAVLLIPRDSPGTSCRSRDILTDVPTCCSLRPPCVHPRPRSPKTRLRPPASSFLARESPTARSPSECHTSARRTPPQPNSRCHHPGHVHPNASAAAGEALTGLPVTASHPLGLERVAVRPRGLPRHGHIQSNACCCISTSS